MQEVLLKSVPDLPKFGNPKALLVWLYKGSEESLPDESAQEEICTRP